MFDKSKYRLIFMGTPQIAATVFEKLILSGWNFIALISNEDKPVGRKRIITPTPCKEIALKYNIPVYQPHRIREDNAFLNDLKPDMILTMAYGQIVPIEVLSCPKYGCLNLHGSLLPKYRGAAPIQRAIINGEKETGITLMEMVMAMDAGKMFAKEVINILDEDNYTSLCEKMSIAAYNICEKYLPLYFEGNLPGIEQNEDEVTFANKINKEDEHLNINLSAVEQVNYIRGLSLTPGAYLILNSQKLKIYSAKVVDYKLKGNIGEISVINNHLVYHTCDKDVEILTLQLEGKKTMDAKSFLNGFKNIQGLVLS